MATASSDFQRAPLYRWWHRIQDWLSWRKSYTLVPVDRQRSGVLATHPRPSDEALLRAYSDSPFPHYKYLRLCARIASLDYNVFVQRANGEPERLRRDHPLWRLLDEPNPALDGWSFRFLTELYVRTIGSCYWRVVADGLRVPRELWIYPPMWVRPVRRRGALVEYVLRGFDGSQARERPERMLWLRTPDPLDPYMKGLGDMLSIATEIDTFELASESDRRFFQNDAQPPGALVVPGQLSKDERDRLHDEWHARVGGPTNAGTVPVLWGGMEYRQFRQGRKEMDFIDGQRFLRDVIITGVHKHILGISDDVTFANAKAADYTMAVWEIAPRIPWWEHYYRRIAAMFDPRLIVRLENPVPEDEAFELERATRGLAAGALKRNEWRIKNGFEPVPDGDVYLLQAGILEVPAAEQRSAPAVASRSGMHGQPPNTQAVDRAAERVPSTVGPDTPRPTAVKQLSERDIREILLVIVDGDLLEDLRGAYETVMASRWRDAMEEVGLDVAFDATSPRVLEYLRTQAGGRIRRIDDTTREAIRDQLQEGIAAGEGIRDLADRIEAVFEEAKGRRAVTIARTETIDASNASAVMAYRQSGLVERIEWLLAPDYDPEEDDGACEAVAARGPVPLGEEFEPGVAWPPLHPNCRCAVSPIVVEEEEQERATATRRKGRRERPRWVGEERKQHITALGHEHARLERLFAAKIKRAFQRQQNTVLRKLRELGKP
ncbi:MAG: phage portal protein [Armatimonadota bacterium]|nr:phage portal protein [Armatimonadota bacterium]